MTDKKPREKLRLPITPHPTTVVGTPAPSNGEDSKTPEKPEKPVAKPEDRPIVH